jgi:hypothetical protein
MNSPMDYREYNLFLILFIYLLIFDQTGLKNLPAFASYQVLGIQACATMPSFYLNFLNAFETALGGCVLFFPSLLFVSFFFSPL